MTEADEEEPERYINVRVRPVWAYIDSVREFCHSICRVTFQSDSVAERVRVIIQELLENAIKYSEDVKVSQLDLAFRASADTFIVNVRSRPRPEHLQNLKKELQLLSTMSAEDAFGKAVHRAAMDPGASTRLGLARLRLEGGVELSLTEEPDGWIRVTAEGIL